MQIMSKFRKWAQKITKKQGKHKKVTPLPERPSTEGLLVSQKELCLRTWLKEARKIEKATLARIEKEKSSFRTQYDEQVLKYNQVCNRELAHLRKKQEARKAALDLDLRIRKGFRDKQLKKCDTHFAPIITDNVARILRVSEELEETRTTLLMMKRYKELS
eukprot:m.19928 g.19928  ORF g.19928 m.19928 type:complete len:161 (+) comp12670_c0_seq1:31-513(+)